MAEDPSHVKQQSLDHVCKLESCNVGTVSALEVLTCNRYGTRELGRVPTAVDCLFTKFAIYI
jgi:hypothetical protein